MCLLHVTDHSLETTRLHLQTLQLFLSGFLILTGVYFLSKDFLINLTSVLSLQQHTVVILDGHEALGVVLSYILQNDRQIRPVCRKGNRKTTGQLSRAKTPVTDAMKLVSYLTVTSSRIVRRCWRMDRKNGSQTVFNVELYSKSKHWRGSLHRTLLSTIQLTTKQQLRRKSCMILILPPFYNHYTRQPALSGNRNWEPGLYWGSFAAHMPLSTANSAFKLERTHQSSPQRCYLHC